MKRESCRKMGRNEKSGPAKIGGAGEFGKRNLRFDCYSVVFT